MTDPDPARHCRTTINHTTTVNHNTTIDRAGAAAGVTDPAADRPATTEEAQQVLAMVLGVAQTQVLAATARLGLADHLATGPRQVAELASLTGTDRAPLTRLLEATAQLGLTRCTGPDRYALTPAGGLLRSDAAHSVRHYAMLMGSDFLADAWPMLPHAVRTGEPQFPAVHGHGYYEYLGHNPSAATAMQLAMSEVSGQESRALLQAYDLSGVERLVDLGGGRGAVLAAVLTEYPQLQGVLVDLPHVAADAHRVLTDAGLQGRFEVVAGSFFTDMPGKGDLYLLKRVLMDRDDEQALTLLGMVREVMAPHGRVVIADPDVDSTYGRMMDMLMLTVFGTRLRTDDEIEALFEGAGFEMTRAVATSSPLRLFEGVPV